MSTIKLGRLEEVDVRKLWSHEQYDFSNWLAKDENIELLNEVLGLTLVDIEKKCLLALIVVTWWLVMKRLVRR